MYYKRKKSKTRLIVIFSSFLLLGALSYGYFSNNKPLERPEGIAEEDIENEVVKESHEKITRENTKEVDNQDIEDETQSEENVNTEENPDQNYLVTKDTEIIFDTHYSQTGEIERNRVKVPVTLSGIGLRDFKEYIEDNYSTWRIKSITTKSVVLYREKEGLTPNTFVLKDKDGYIAVYKINERGKEELFDETDISTTHLPEADREKLDRGIKVKSLDEVESLIQDYSS